MPHLCDHRPRGRRELRRLLRHALADLPRHGRRNRQHQRRDAATAGQIVTYDGKPAITYFFASSGGHTEAVQDAFPGAAAQPWLVGVADPYDQGPEHSWTQSLSFATAGKRLSGLVKGSFRGIEVLTRGSSPRILTAYVLGSAGRTLTSGGELAARLGLDDTWAYFCVKRGTSVVSEPDRSGSSAPASPTPTTSASHRSPPAPAAARRDRRERRNRPRGRRGRGVAPSAGGPVAEGCPPGAHLRYVSAAGPPGAGILMKSTPDRRHVRMSLRGTLAVLVCVSCACRAGERTWSSLGGHRRTDRVGTEGGHQVRDSGVDG